MNMVRLLIPLIIALAVAPQISAQDKPKPGVDRTDAGAIIADQRLKRMTAELTLTEEQRSKVRPLIVEDMKKMATIRDDQSLNTEQKRAKMASSRDEFNDQVKAVLAPEQKTKFEASLARGKKPAKAAPKGPKPDDAK